MKRTKKYRYKIGDVVTVIAYTPFRYPPGVKDELGTEGLFKSMVGKKYRIYGFDRYGHLELRPTRLDTVWIGKEDVKLRARGSRR